VRETGCVVGGSIFTKVLLSLAGLHEVESGGGLNAFRCVGLYTPLCFMRDASYQGHHDSCCGIVGNSEVVPAACGFVLPLWDLTKRVTCCNISISQVILIYALCTSLR
jgi:hypothetical protein